MRFTWGEAKRKQNLKAHGIDFVDAVRVFEGPTFTFEDDRFTYSEGAWLPWACSPGFRYRLSIQRPNMKSTSSRSAKPRGARRKSSSTISKTDWARLRAMSDQDINLTPEHPEAEVEHIVSGIVRRGLEPPPSKAAVSLRIDRDVLEWFKSQGPGYQTRINAVLRAFRDASV